jgi:hypothetical protein
MDYFLNAELDTNQVTYAICLIEKIKESLDEKKMKGKISLSKDLTELKLEQIFDVLETYFFNEKSVYLEFLDNRKYQMEMLDIALSEDLSRMKKKWLSLCLESLKYALIESDKTPYVIAIKKPRGFEHLSKFEVLQVALNLSKYLDEEVGYRVQKELDDRWKLRLTH